MSTSERTGAAPPTAAVVTQEAVDASTAEPPVYRMQLQPRARVTFDDSVVDNEHLGRKKSNKCCVFHKKRAFGESSSESGEDDSGSDASKKTPHDRRCPQHGQRHRKPRSQRPTKPSPFVPASGGDVGGGDDDSAAH